MNRENAQRIGLLPRDVPIDRVEMMKDGALEGAKKMLLDPDLDGTTSRLIKRIEHIPLHSQGEFNDLFAAAMGF